jgi:hypothetical protein
MHSSPNRVHVFWRAAGFTIQQIERLQKHLAHELDTDLAATPASQLTRLPGLFNHKYAPPHAVRIDYGDTGRLWTPADFPEPDPIERWTPPSRPLAGGDWSNSERARRYLETIPPAVAGEHGDLHTFRVCCRLVRGFALDDHEALTLLALWNLRCIPPWSERDLHDKILRARRYGREPIGGLLGSPVLRG